jgi:hypothetical protein
MTFTELSTRATQHGCTLARGKDAGYKSGFKLTMGDGSSKWLGTLQQVSRFLDRVEASQELLQIVRNI